METFNNGNYIRGITLKQNQTIQTENLAAFTKYNAREVIKLC